MTSTLAPDESLWTQLLRQCGERAPAEARRIARAAGADVARLEAQLANGDPPWWLAARPAQQLPPPPWRVAVWLGGRGSGKTRCVCENFAEVIAGHPGRQWGVVAPTFGAARDVDIEGPSGLLRALERRELVREWNRSYGELWLTCGGRVKCDGADDGADRIQGENLSGVLADEIGLWRRSSWERAWKESVTFAVRIEPALIVAGGTPKRGHPLVRHLLKEPGAIVRTMHTLDNRANLHPDTLRALLAQYRGTTLGRQELEGAFLEDVPGALWRREWIERDRVEQAPATRTRCVVAVDPAVTAGPDSDETGIVVACRGEADGYVLADLSGRFRPQQWAWRAVQAFTEHRADFIAAEVNNGGDMVVQTIHQIDPSVPVRKITATRGKALRAQPVALLAEQGRVHHVGAFPELEEQLVTWDPEGEDRSPDRLDAYVYAVTACCVNSVVPSAGWAG